MKKLIYLIVLALILGLVLTGCLLSNVGQVPATEQSGIAYLTRHTEDAPFVTDLIADGGDAISATNVGEVLVWNDGDTLYVQYVVTAPWCLTETHLHVFLDNAEYTDVPQKNGNPIPGKFDYKGKHDCLADYTYEIPLIWNPCIQLFIAAHAKVIRPVDDCWETAWQIGDVESNPTAIPSTTLSDEFGGKNSDGSLYALGDIVDYSIPPNDFRLDYDGDMAAFPFAFAPPGWTHSIYGDVFTETVNIHYSEYMPFGGKLTWRWTAGRSAPETYDVSHDASLLQTYVDKGKLPEGFYEHSLTIPVASGNQMITFDHRLDGDGGRWDWIRLEKPCEREETAWGAGFGFPGKNWATYFTYTVQQMVCPCILGKSENIEVLDAPPPTDVRVGALENDDYIRVWKEFEGILTKDLCYDLDEGKSARIDGPPSTTPSIPAGTYVCIYYVHLDNVGPSSTVQQTGQIKFGADILGLIISGGSLGTFAGRDLMFAADSSVGNSGTIYPDKTGVNYWRGFDVKYGGNLDDAVFIESTVDFTMWVINAHDSFRVILPMVSEPCE